jgi:TonB family protein
MALPDPKSKPVTAPKEAPREATGKTPSTGAKPQEGSTRAQTQVRGQGFGLSSGGGGGSGIRVDSDFCCPEYIIEMRDRIRENWRNEGIPGLTTYKFVVQRDGTITNVQLEKSSGLGPLDFNAQRSLLLTRRLPPLPDAYTNPTLTVHLDFDTSIQ